MLFPLLIALRMAETVIKVENLSKRYRLGIKEEQADTLIGQISQAIRSPWENLKRLRQLSRFGQEDESVFWALKDISFEVKEGEVLGIIGKNGAGKSTLLKILSQITEPTSGKVEILGRVASLLEVGTGFHPELSGRENIYMNGTILGMTRKEIDAKLDEIIDFSGVEKFIDTPVKFYSSGMKVRLGFSVAAHLDPEILIIDEVLAVGDAEFQKKCLGKMNEVSRGQGRTVLFVSHNIHSIFQLCNKALFLEKGVVLEAGSVSQCVNRYLEQQISYEVELHSPLKLIEVPIITKVMIIKEKLSENELEVLFEFKSPFVINSPSIGLVLNDYLGNPVFGTNNRIHTNGNRYVNSKEGVMKLSIRDLSLFPGTYSISVFLGDSISDYASYTDILSFDIQNKEIEAIQIPDTKYIGSLYLRNVTWEFLSSK